MSKLYKRILRGHVNKRFILSADWVIVSARFWSSDSTLFRACIIYFVYGGFQLSNPVGYRYLSRPQVDLTFERFRFLAPCQRLRAIVCVLSAHLRRVLKSTCVCLRLREQCLRSEITSVSRVANDLLLRLVAGNMDVNTPASKRSQLIGTAAIVRKRGVIHKKSTCVCWRLSVAAFTQRRRDASFDLWPPLYTVRY